MSTFDPDYEVDLDDLLSEDSGFHADDLDEDSAYEDYILDRYDDRLESNYDEEELEFND